MGNWALSGCCGVSTGFFIGLFGAYLLFDVLTWSLFFMKPMKLLAVLVHEFCHATACLMTCGKVTGLQITTDEGGVAHYQGGWQWFIIPAGYLGGAAWGAGMIVMSADKIAQYVLCGLLLSMMVYALYKAENWTLRWVAIFHLVLLLVFLFVEIFTPANILKFITLFYGTFVSVFSIYDIYDDTVRRVVYTETVKSDAVACAQMFPCLPSRGWGILWAIVATGFLGGGFYLALVILETE